MIPIGNLKVKMVEIVISIVFLHYEKPNLIGIVKRYNVANRYISYKIKVKGNRILIVELNALFSKNNPVLKTDITLLMPDLYFLVAPILSFL